MASTPPSSPVAVVCVGMAGSGKTTFMQRINAHLHTLNTPPYVMNLDPAVRTVPFDSNIDIRDSVNYKEVMKQYNLGPNGGILTSLNLFATKIDQVLAILEKRCLPAGAASTTLNPTPREQSTAAAAPAQSSKPITHILFDTPGQIEVFVWSASGDILLGSLASSFPTVLAYIIDTPRTTSTSTFMSNMLYACSILYKTKLPMILVFNKTDIQDAEFAKEWMTDFEAFQAALRREQEEGEVEGGMGGSGYMNSLLNSMSLVLEEFYCHLSVVGVSSMTGQGVDEFFAAVKEKAVEFERDYKPELERRRNAREKDKESQREKEVERLMNDMAVSRSGQTPASKRQPSGRWKDEPETVSEAEEALSDEDEDGMEGGLVDPDEDDPDAAHDGDEYDEEGLAQSLSNGAEKVYSIDFGSVGSDFDAVAQRFPGRLLALNADVTSEASVTEAVDKIIAEAGGLHGIVCNAGRTKHKPALDFTTEEIKQQWSVNQPDWEQQLKYYGGLPRLTEVEELRGAYVYLLSDAASYTTSIDIPVNGVIGIC
ncbi:hypothetical protein B0A49_09177 [Cryomyces minteri]|uniref:GPN-loop GTPase 1 n=1 Tax=Cryomyces minteri TaxID=331657 RepID=A0A4U0WK38_9PEZI|nr:hypothetical protein B0A49_09177 [Cryomyces minteri]